MTGEITEIEIKCQGVAELPLESLTELQGDLKELSEANYVKIRNSLVTFGFSFPVFVWLEPETNTNYILDGHQRVRVLNKMRTEEGIKIPPLPVDYIQAKDKKEAKEKLLLLNSQYAKFNQEGWDAFTYDLDIGEISDMLEIPEMEHNYISQEERESANPKEVECPNCHMKFVPKT